MSYRVAIKSPVELSNNVYLSYEANDINVSIGADVTSVADKSGNGNNAIPKGSTYTAPKFQIDANGYKYLQYSRDLFTTMTSTTGQSQPAEITICLALFITDFKSETKEIFGAGTGANLKDRIRIQADGNVLFVASVGSVPAQFNSGAGVAKPNVPVIISYKRDSSNNITAWLNTKKIISSVLTTYIPATNTFPYNMGTLGPNANYFIDGGYYALHVINEALPDDKVLKLIRYTACKSGIKI